MDFLSFIQVVDKLGLILVWMKENPQPFIEALQNGTLQLK